mmetsp:Transcript_17728/g.58006  ORF Transcript_17728/g.58006 Transcript_17728/m.58006 type:complete len:217 (+) Transcript_17728:692-1342(+)
MVRRRRRPYSPSYPEIWCRRQTDRTAQYCAAQHDRRACVEPARGAPILSAHAQPLRARARAQRLGRQALGAAAPLRASGLHPGRALLRAAPQPRRRGDMGARDANHLPRAVAHATRSCAPPGLRQPPRLLPGHARQVALLQRLEGRRELVAPPPRAGAAPEQPGLERRAHAAERSPRHRVQQRAVHRIGAPHALHVAAAFRRRERGRRGCVVRARH